MSSLLEAVSVCLAEESQNNQVSSANSENSLSTIVRVRVPFDIQVEVIIDNCVPRKNTVNTAESQDLISPHSKSKSSIIKLSLSSSPRSVKSRQSSCSSSSSRGSDGIRRKTGNVPMIIFETQLSPPQKLQRSFRVKIDMMNLPILLCDHSRW
jgi:hypothetical protein